MIAWVSLFLGLVSGVQTVEVSAGKDVAAVELRLDGRAVERMRQAPWAAKIDFGPTIRPHKLEAVAFAADGREAGGCRQFVNVPRKSVEATIDLQTGEKGVPVAARVSWDSLEFQQARSIRALFDGAELRAMEPGRFALPALSMERMHFLSARVQLPNGAVAGTEIVFGGSNTEGAAAELTAVPVVVKEGASIGGPADLKGLFRAGSTPLEPVAVEQSAAQIVVVVDAGAGRDLANLGGWSIYVRDSRDVDKLGENEFLRFMLTVPQGSTNRGRQLQLFDVSQRFSSADGSIPRYLMSKLPKLLTPGAHQTIADAVAVAGLQASEDNGPRAVVVLLSRAANDQSGYDIAAVRSFLEDLRVPLIVWSTLRPTDKHAVQTWGPVEDVSSAIGLARALNRALAAVRSQRIVWVRGRYLPTDVTLAGPANGFTVAGATASLSSPSPPSPLPPPSTASPKP